MLLYKTFVLIGQLECIHDSAYMAEALLLETCLIKPLSVFLLWFCFVLGFFVCFSPCELLGLVEDQHA
jgi:hypothetical protein